MSIGSIIKFSYVDYYWIISQKKILSSAFGWLASVEYSETRHSILITDIFT